MFFNHLSAVVQNHSEIGSTGIAGIYVMREHFILLQSAIVMSLNTTFLLMAQYGGKAIIPVDELKTALATANRNRAPLNRGAIMASFSQPDVEFTRTGAVATNRSLSA